MKFDYISDLHIDRNGIDIIESLIRKSKSSDYCFIAGDIAEDMHSIIKTLKLFSEHYKKVFYVPGNHELLLPANKTFLEKYILLQTNISKISGVEFLDGNIIEIEGITISGLGMWYDGSYLRSKYNYLQKHEFEAMVNKEYRTYMIDSQYLGRDLFKIFNFFQDKLSLISEDIDIMVSHVNPMNTEKFMGNMFKKSESNAFFCFNGRNFISSNNVKVWIFGHTHDLLNKKFQNTRLLCNPYGYPNENMLDTLRIRTFEFKKDNM